MNNKYVLDCLGVSIEFRRILDQENLYSLVVKANDKRLRYKPLALLKPYKGRLWRLVIRFSSDHSELLSGEVLVGDKGNFAEGKVSFSHDVSDETLGLITPSAIEIQMTPVDGP